MIAPDAPIAVIGHGYVGLPLAVEFGKHRPVIGFDVKLDRIAALRQGRDHTREVHSADLASATHLTFTADPADLAAARVFIVTVPTPIDAHKRPDLTALLGASETVGPALNCPDLRNTRVVDVAAELADYGVAVEVQDPWVDPSEAKAEYGLVLSVHPDPDSYDGVLLAVPHTLFIDGGIEELRRFGRRNHVFFDLKSRFRAEDSDLRL
ncbi:UDP binding domain-containing protein [Oceaniglobus roseus]|uniref:UDP binding domain-containing protein n=1 Tax=Oceaniglobus roseus TaxID=1737570 RepID=UPI000C7F3425|nr:UDP binding domain-containing protein [Kandeliimicrobium roseum]